MHTLNQNQLLWGVNVTAKAVPEPEAFTDPGLSHTGLLYCGTSHHKLQILGAEVPRAFNREASEAGVNGVTLRDTERGGVCLYAARI